MRISFFGAAREVTGSCSLLETEGKKILIDCGMFQGGEFNEKKNHDPFPFNAKEINSVIVTHAHLDHVGRLPILAKEGFTGPIYATPATIKLMQLILDDALEVMRYNERHLGHAVLFAEEDIAKVASQFVAVDYSTPQVVGARFKEQLKVAEAVAVGSTALSPFQGEIQRGLPFNSPPPSPRGATGDLPSSEDTAASANKISGSSQGRPTPPYPPLREGEEATGRVIFTFHDAGHIFGSAFAEIQAKGKRIVFSGDVGNVDVPIVRDTQILPANLDALVCESTYGGRIHETISERQEIIEKMVVEAINRGGVLMIPSFSIERTQELLYELSELVRARRLPKVPIFLDSPLAIGATKVFREYPEYYDEQAESLFKKGDDLFEFAGLTMCQTREESKRINQVPVPKIIIAGAGMMNGGRIVHHALRYLSDQNSTLLFIGYQAQGTLGRKILDGESSVSVLGEKVRVRCRIKAIGALSAHGDQEKLLNWIGGGIQLPKKVYINHGEPAQSEALANRLTGDLGVKATVVDYGLSVKV